jgi:hypothetical protein
VIGGLVVRDPALPGLYGRYLYGDHCTGQLRSFRLCGGVVRDDRLVTSSVPGLTSFGEDGQHHVYVTAQSDDDGSGSAARLTWSPPGGGDPGPGCPPPATHTGSTKDIVTPDISRFTMGSRVFRAARKGASVARRKPPVGTRVGYRLSEAATARFTIERAAKGRKKGHKCVRSTKKNRKAKRCNRYVRLRGSFSRISKAGLSRFRFTGRLRGKKLRHGRYRLVLVATDAALNKSKPKRAKFRIVSG